MPGRRSQLGAPQRADGGLGDLGMLPGWDVTGVGCCQQGMLLVWDTAGMGMLIVWDSAGMGMLLMGMLLVGMLV